MHRVTQSPTDPAFVQDPYPFYDRLRTSGDLVWWEEYAMPCAASHRAVHGLLRDKRFGREIPPERRQPVPPHLTPFYAVESNSMLELEAPRHTRLRKLVLRAFTSRQIKALEPGIAALCHSLIDAFPDGAFDLIPAYCQPIPIRIICRLLGVPDRHAAQLLTWSHAMVAMYQAGRDRPTEEAAARAAADFTAFLRAHLDQRRSTPSDDLISHLIAAEADGTSLSADELIATCILLLNAGHEATVHTLGNGVKTLLDCGLRSTSETAVAETEEILRFDPPLHMFTRYAYENVTVYGHRFQRGDQVALLLAAANRDPRIWPDPHRFDPARAMTASTSFGGGIHFCVGAALARLELHIALPILFDRCPKLRLTQPPLYADCYHFHGLQSLMVTR